MGDNKEKIFSLFLTEPKLKFSEIERRLDMRSNLLAYHIEQMVKEGVLEKEGDMYSLTQEAEKVIPSHGSSLPLLPVLLIAIKRGDEYLLIRRDKRPYRGYWAMVGGKVKLEETFDDAAKRLALTKTGVEIEFKRVNAVLHEFVTTREEPKHGFLLIMVTAEAVSGKAMDKGHGEVKWVKNFDDGLIPSDKWLLENKLDDTLEVRNIQLQDNEGEISSFKFI